ncbi:MAG: NAD+ synthase [Candidatus Eremiobacteraeota bacterium]|nr:NAD+ synthase [Candidatus Eremiobacteraeota bacterium]
MQKIRIALAQMNATVGDLDGNTVKIIENIRRARENAADIVIFPELTVCGYPPEDLLLKKEFISRNLECISRITAETSGITAIVGFVDAGEDIYNAAACLHDGACAGVVHKFFLPNYGVFDENRYFQSGTEYKVFRLGDVTFGIVVCEDIWYSGGPAQVQALLGDAQLILSINASPFYCGKWKIRERILGTRAFDGSFFLAYVNAVGGQDELIFDGQSLVFSPTGELLSRACSHQEDLLFCDIDISEAFRDRLIDPRRRKAKLELRGTGQQCVHASLNMVAPENKPPCEARITEPPGEVEEMYRSLVLGIRDYVRKNGFSTVVLGLSGGIDSALTASLAVAALGSGNVVGVSMPSPYTSQESRKDGVELAGNLGIRLIEIPIEEPFSAFKEVLSPVFKDLKENITEENVQARVRGTLLMALSNKFGWLVLTTGNKSEIACGYCTLYGDTAGGFSVLKDVYKTQVYALSEFINGEREIIPRRSITKAPTAELRPNQKDTDSLPPYELLDHVLHHYIEKEMSIEEMVHLGFESALVKSVVRLVDRNEYKRRQAPPGIKISEKAFGKDRRLPVTNLFKPWE